MCYRVQPCATESPARNLSQRTHISLACRIPDVTLLMPAHTIEALLVFIYPPIERAQDPREVRCPGAHLAAMSSHARGAVPWGVLGGARNASLSSRLPLPMLRRWSSACTRARPAYACTRIHHATHRVRRGLYTAHQRLYTPRPTRFPHSFTHTRHAPAPPLHTRLAPTLTPLQSLPYTLGFLTCTLDFLTYMVSTPDCVVYTPSPSRALLPTLRYTQGPDWMHIPILTVLPKYPDSAHT